MKMCVLHTLKCRYKALITRKWENVLMVCQYKKDNTVTAITILILNLMFMDKNQYQIKLYVHIHIWITNWFRIKGSHWWQVYQIFIW